MYYFIIQATCENLHTKVGSSYINWSMSVRNLGFLLDNLEMDHD